MALAGRLAFGILIFFLMVLLYVHTDTFDLTTAPELRIAFLCLFCTLGLGCVGADQVVEWGGVIYTVLVHIDMVNGNR